MTQARWLTIPDRGPLRSDALAAIVDAQGRDPRMAWEAVEEPRHLVELALVSGQPVDRILGAIAVAANESWANWSEGATDTRPPQVVAALQSWLGGRAGFEEIWSTWELADTLRTEVRQWYQAQEGAVLATAIANLVEGVYGVVATARNLAEPEPGHDQHDPARYARKNADPAYRDHLFEVLDAVDRMSTAGSWWHSHREPQASQKAHEVFVQQDLGFVLRRELSSDDVVEGLRRRL